MGYAQHFSTRKTPQSEAIPGKNQVENSAGGFSFPVDDWTRLERFLVLGNEGGSYYASEKQLTKENANCVLRCFNSDEKRTIDTIVELSKSGRIPKNDTAIFALALCSNSSYALSKLNDVCRTGTHLFQFVDAVKNFRGWGKALRKAVSNWYLSKSAKDLSYQVTKYQQRNGWSHRDVLRLSHPKTKDSNLNSVFKYIVSDDKVVENVNMQERNPIDFKSIIGFERAKSATGTNEIVSIIKEFDLVRECVPTEFLNKPEVWKALLQKMPIMAMVRNLGKMANVGLLKPMSSATQLVVERLQDKELLRKSRLHPLSILLAGSVYSSGRGFRGSLTWSIDSNIVNALDEAFYLAFDNVEPTGKRHLLALDVSGSMTAKINNTFLSCREAAAAMSMVAVKTEPWTHTVGFTAGDGRGWVREPVLSQLPFNKSTSLNESVKATSGLPFGGTDCALPMIYALKNKIEADAFVVYTDSETWHGDIHPCQALEEYRQKMGIPAKLVVCGMVSNGFSIANPDDGGCLDVVGFDTATPNIISDFVRS